MPKKVVSKNIKKWYQSKTIRLAAISIIIGVFSWVQGQIEAGASITVMGVLMTVMRLISNTKLE